MKLNPKDPILIFKIASHYDNRLEDIENAIRYYELFLETRQKTNPEPPVIDDGTVTLSYYDYAVRRVKELRKELFWEGDKKRDK